jgi:hypothetical protein
MHPYHELTIVLAIRHPGIDPEVLTREFGLEPRYSWRAGDSRPPVGEPPHGDGRYRESYWAAELYPSPDPFPARTFDAIFRTFPMSLPSIELSLGEVLGFATLILKRRQQFWGRLMKEGAKAEFLVALANRDRINLKLDSDLLGMMASLGISVAVDVQSYARAAA